MSRTVEDISTVRPDLPLPPTEEDYFGHLRLDVLGLVPADAKHVLSVGCGAGVTEGELVRRGMKVTGIEQNPAAAAIARGLGLTVVAGDAARIGEDELTGHPFDCLIYADVLEHMLDPQSVLRRHVTLLRPGGEVVVSIPNFRHFSVFWELFVRGRIDYTDAGIMDRTHVRLTTSRLIKKWLHEVGLCDVRVSYWSGRRRERLAIACTFGLAREFFARQIFLQAKKPN